MRKIYNLLILSLLMVGATSCSSDDCFNEWDATYAYLAPEHLGLLTTEFTLLHKTEIEGPETKIQFYAALNKASTKDVVVELLLDTSKTLNQSMVSLSSQTVTIPAGKLKSEPIQMSIEDWSSQSNITSETEYSANVKLAKVQTKDILTGAQSKLGMLITKQALLNIAVGAPKEGTLIADRAAWNITVQEEVENANNPGVLIDGTTTDVAVNSGGFWIIIDLTKSTLVTGIKTNSWASSFAPRGIELFVSDNGVKWESHGKLQTSGAEQNIKFVTPVTTRYIKYDIFRGSSNGRLDITEFNVYAK